MKRHLQNALKGVHFAKVRTQESLPVVVYRDTIDRNTGECVESKLIRTNHARAMYECTPEMVIQEK